MTSSFDPLWNPTPRRRPRGLLLGAGLVVGGAAAGIIAATALGANAANTTTSANGPASVAYAAASGNSAPSQPEPVGGHRGLDNSGTVTAVGTNSVTIKTASGTKTYGVTASSDIDKNGEAQLKDLVVGDAVTFSTDTANGQAVIDKLHAGDESKDMPAPPAGTGAAG